MIKRIADIIRSGKRFLISAHIRLDGDALGSELALFLALRDMGKEAVIYNQDDTPQMYAFLPGLDAVTHTLEAVEGFDAAFLLDCSDFERVGDEWAKIAAMEKVVNIDHHISNDFFSDLSLVDVEASSTGEILYRLMIDMGVAITKDIAINLYTAILTDTGSFRYSNTAASTLAVASDLVLAGVDPRWVAENVYESRTIEQVALLREALGTLEIHEDIRTGIMSVSRQMMADTGAMPEHTDGFVDLIRSIGSITVAVFLQETSGNYYKISFRSKGEVNVERVAASFGGGGHVNASACRIAGDGETVKKTVLDALQAFLS
jgi:phosphoesterase RecJ-like protein